MNRPVLPLLFALICLFSTDLLIAQPPSWKWFDPATSAVPVISGRGWDMTNEGDSVDFYARLPLQAEKTLRPEVWKLSRDCAGEYIELKTSATTIIVRYKLGKPALSMVHMPITGTNGLGFMPGPQKESGDGQEAHSVLTIPSNTNSSIYPSRQRRNSSGSTSLYTTASAG